MHQITASQDEVELAVAVGQLKQSRQYELTLAVLEHKSFSVAQRFISAGERLEARSIIAQCADLGIEVTPLTISAYPPLLREINSPPPVLYVKRGDARSSIPLASFGVVGARAASIEVCEQTSEIARTLAEHGLTIASGLALGVDGAAHRGALRSSAHCPTIAVLAHGLDRVYPPTHFALARQIMDAGGVLVSEYAPYVEPKKHHFLARNRIIAGLSQGVLVVAAGARSGSLVTANFAADYGRDVFVLAGDDEDQEQREGCQALLDQGATPISSAYDVLQQYRLVAEDQAELTRCQWTTTTVDAFAQETGLSVGELLKLELQGKIVRLPGNRVRVWSEVRS